MKNFKNLVAAVLILCLSTSCANSNFYSNLKKSTPYLRSSSAIITQVVLSNAVSDKDRKEKAQEVLKVAALIEEMTVDGDISLETFGEKISHFVPDGAFWDEFAAGLIFVYADFHSRTQELEESEKQKILLLALNKIAAGCRMSAELFD